MFLCQQYFTDNNFADDNFYYNNIAFVATLNAVLIYANKIRIIKWHLYRNANYNTLEYKT